MRQLSGTDDQFLNAETRNTPEHIGSISIYDPATARNGFVRFKDILRTFESRLDRAPIFTQRLHRAPLDIDRPYWVEDPDFDLEHHVRHIALPKPGDWRQLCILIARLHSISLDLDRPLWVAYVIEGIDNIPGLPEGSFALYTKMHHAAVDGMAGSEFLTAIHDLTPVFPEGDYGDDLRHRKVKRAPGTIEMAARTYVNLAKQPFAFAKTAAGLAPQALRDRKFRKDHDMAKTPSRPKTRFDGLVSPNRVFGATEFDLEKIKAIRASIPELTVNDIAVGIISRALRSYLGDKKELPDKPLVGWVPVSLRNQEEAGSGGNRISTLIVPIHTDIDDPFMALQTIHETMKKSKARRQDVGDPLLVQVIDNSSHKTQAILGKLANIGTKFGVGPVPANVAISNVPGPPIPVYLSGAKAVRVYGIGILQHGVGLFNVIGRYLDKFTISFLACRKQMPDPQIYADCIEAAFEELYTAAMAQIADQKE